MYKDDTGLHGEAGRGGVLLHRDEQEHAERNRPVGRNGASTVVRTLSLMTHTISCHVTSIRFRHSFTVILSSFVYGPRGKATALACSASGWPRAGHAASGESAVRRSARRRGRPPAAPALLVSGPDSTPRAGAALSASLRPMPWGGPCFTFSELFRAPTSARGGVHCNRLSLPFAAARCGGDRRVCCIVCIVHRPSSSSCKAVVVAKPRQEQPS